MLRPCSLVLFLLGILPSAAWGDHGKGAVGGKTISPRTLHEEDASLDLGFRYQKSETFDDSRLLSGAAEGHDIHSVDWLAEFSAAFGYGVTDHLTISASVPFEVIHGFRFVDTDPNTGNPFVNGANSIVGVGDATLLGKYSLLADPIELAVVGGIKIPTGSTDQRTNTGDLIEADHQPGSGSWDPLVGIAAGRQFEQFWLGTSVLYRITTEGRRQFTPGQSVLFAMKAEYQILGLGKFPRLYGSLELSEQFTAKDEQFGMKNQDTGGSLVGLGFGLRLRADEHLTLGGMFTVPVYQALNGLQHRERYDLLLGTAYDF
ncbi:MAG TPA: hypothetical protein VKU80_16350 [Planctomycetota bacterium]|nr:hypothetical protein [Planctomycetota bacterium]